ncbi:MAG: macro domain-containing protein, partial [Verrucomicrobiota bacterium]
GGGAAPPPPAAGPELLAACRTLAGCATGEAKITRGYRLNVSWVIHTVGPIWRGGGHDEDVLLARCYQNCFLLAVRNKITTIAFPAISTGAYRFPMERAAKIAVEETRRFLRSNPTMRKVIFVCFNGATLEGYRRVLAERSHEGAL